MAKLKVGKKEIEQCLEARLDTRVFYMPDILLEFGYTASKLQSLFGGRDQGRRSQNIENGNGEKRERKKKKKL